MARKAGNGAKRGPKPKMTKEDGEALAKQLRRLTKLVRQIHAEVVPGSTEGAPEPEVEVAPESAKTEPVNGATAAPVLPIEVEITETPATSSTGA